MIFTNPAFLALRRVLRATRLAGPIAKLIGGRGYEQLFNQRLEASARPGDCVWDVGANVGYYSTRFAKLCGETGRVFAFEPSPANSTRLRQATAGLANVTALQLALSDREGTAAFRQGDDELGATSRVVADGTDDAVQSIAVQVTTGDKLVAQGAAQPPNVMKVDVEGHELEVLRGLSHQLARLELRDIFVEVHFGLLDAAGRSDAPGTIVGILEGAGLRVEWVDPSHLHASR